MATDAQINDLVSLYVGYFNRVPDPAGLQFWIDQIDNGREYGTIAGDFAGSVEAKALYPFLENAQDVSPDAFVTTIYQNLFNREADPAGRAFWIEVLASGAVPVGDMIESIINGAVDAPEAAIPTFDAQVLANKGTVGLNYVTQSNLYRDPNFEIRDLREFLEPVTSEPVSVILAERDIDAFLEQFEPNPDFKLQTALTLDADFLDQSDDAIFVVHAIDGKSIENSLQSSDILNPGRGTDELNATFNNAGTVAPTLTSVEHIFVEATNGSSTLDLTNATGVQQVWNMSSTAELIIDNIEVGTFIGLQGETITGDTTFNFADANGSDDAATLLVDASQNITDNFVTINDIEDLTIVIKAENTNTQLTDFIADDATSITVLGQGNSLQFLNDADSRLGSLEVLDASGFTGVFNVNFDFVGGDKNGVSPMNGVTVTGSSDGGDDIRLARVGIDENIVSHNDIIVFNESAGSTVDDRTKVIYFKHGTSDDKIDISAFGLGGVSSIGTTDFDPTADVINFFSNAGSAIVQSTARDDFIYVDTNNNGDFDADTDLAVNIAGVTSIDDFILA